MTSWLNIIACQPCHENDITLQHVNGMRRICQWRHVEMTTWRIWYWHFDEMTMTIQGDDEMTIMTWRLKMTMQLDWQDTRLASMKGFVRSMSKKSEIGLRMHSRSPKSPYQLNEAPPRRDQNKLDVQRPQPTFYWLAPSSGREQQSPPTLSSKKFQNELIATTEWIISNHRGLSIINVRHETGRRSSFLAAPTARNSL